MSSNGEQYWSTENELTYVKNICTRTINGVQITRRQIIKKYHDAALRRKDCGNVDAAKVIHVLETELQGASE